MREVYKESGLPKDWFIDERRKPMTDKIREIADFMEDTNLMGCKNSSQRDKFKNLFTALEAEIEAKDTRYKGAQSALSRVMGELTEARAEIEKDGELLEFEK